MARSEVKAFLDFVSSVESGDEHIGTNAEKALHKIMVRYDQLRDKTDELEAASASFMKCLHGRRLDNEEVVRDITGGEYDLINVILFQAVKESGWPSDIKELASIPEIIKSLVVYVNNYLALHENDIQLDETELAALGRVRDIGNSVESLVDFEREYSAAMTEISKECADSEFTHEEMTDEEFVDDVTSEIDEFYADTKRSCHPNIAASIKKLINAVFVAMVSRKVSAIGPMAEFTKMMREGFNYPPDVAASISKVACWEKVDDELFDRTYRMVFNTFYMSGVRDDTTIVEHWFNNRDACVSETGEIKPLIFNSDCLTELYSVLNKALIMLDSSNISYEVIMKNVMINALGFDKDLIENMQLHFTEYGAAFNFETKDLYRQFCREVERFTPLEARMLVIEYFERIAADNENAE